MLPPVFPESAGCCNLRRKRIKYPCTCAQTRSSLTDGTVDINTLSNFILVCLNAVIFPLFVKHGAPLPEGLFTLTTANVATNNHPFYTNEIMLFKENLSPVFFIFFIFFCACASTTAAVWFHLFGLAKPHQERNPGCLEFAFKRNFIIYIYYFFFSSQLSTISWGWMSLWPRAACHLSPTLNSQLQKWCPFTWKYAGYSTVWAVFCFFL